MAAGTSADRVTLPAVSSLFPPEDALVRRLTALPLVACLVCAAALAALPTPTNAQTTPLPPDPATGTPAAESELRDVAARFTADRAALLRRFPVAQSPGRGAALERFYADWSARLGAMAFDTLSAEGRIDHVLLATRITYERTLASREAQWWTATTPLLPFAAQILALNDARLRMETLDAAHAAGTLDALAARVDDTRKAVEADAAKTDKLVAFRAQEAIESLKATLKSWHDFYDGYDPLFTWWNRTPYDALTKSLDAYRKALRERVLGIKAGDDEPIVGMPIGRAALVSDLASEFVAYSPEELLAIGEREYAWCEAEMKKASREMGLGDNWLEAVEKVKNLYVDPGRQPDLIRDLALEAERYVKQHGLVTVPPLAKQVWRMQMMTPERQRVNPFFTGGEVISVSFPTDTMDHDDKRMSLRGNNMPFARATVFHELIPGHHLQGFMTARYNAHRQAFSTPFWGEGWALYWEMLLWDRGFADTPEKRVGALFWRMHRASRIIFSLRFHLGEWTPRQCIDFLVERGGHERANAEAEVRRSFNGTYPPLYQLAYMMGGLQFRALHAEFVGSGRMNDRTFHDAILTGGTMPVEMVRARLQKQPLPRDHRPTWKFAQ